MKVAFRRNRSLLAHSEYMLALAFARQTQVPWSGANFRRHFG
jgi:hypothetical protein